MEKIKIITDSTLDLPADLIKEKGIEVLPLLINFGEESYLDGVEINIHQMLERIEKDNILPTTAQVTPNRFEEVFKKYLDEGYKIVALLLSSEMSGTYQSACIAKNMLESDDIVVIDSKNVTSGLGVLALKACEFRDNGDSIIEIEEKIKVLIPKVRSSLGFESLENLVKGGRLSKTAGTIGSVLGLRLILEVKDGKMAVKDKVRGSKKALKKIISDFENGNVDMESPIVLLEILNQEIYLGLKKYFEEKTSLKTEVNNDANVAGLAEAMIGSAKGAESVFYITVSTGVGGALIIDNKIINGANSFAGEICNLIINEDKYSHSGLVQGGLEGQCSGPNISRQATDLLGKHIDTPEVFELYKNNDNSIKSLINGVCENLSIGISNIISVVDPEVIVLGGSVILYNKELLEVITKKVKEKVINKDAVDIRIAEIGDDAGLRGAGFLII